MIGRVFTRILSRLPGSALAYLIAYLVFNDVNYGLIAALSFAVGNWFNASLVLVIIASVKIITQEMNYALAAGLAFEIGLRVFLAYSRLKSGSL